MLIWWIRRKRRKLGLNWRISWCFRIMSSGRQGYDDETTDLNSA